MESERQGDWETIDCETAGKWMGDIKRQKSDGRLGDIRL